MAAIGRTLSVMILRREVDRLYANGDIGEGGHCAGWKRRRGEEGVRLEPFPPNEPGVTSADKT